MLFPISTPSQQYVKSKLSSGRHDFQREISYLQQDIFRVRPRSLHLQYLTSNVAEKMGPTRKAGITANHQPVFCPLNDSGQDQHSYTLCSLGLVKNAPETFELQMDLRILPPLWRPFCEGCRNVPWSWLCYSVPKKGDLASVMPLFHNFCLR